VKQYTARVDSTERVLSSGQVLVPGEPADLSAEDQKDEHNKRLIDEGQIVEFKKEAKS
jgi:hypothetical protein